MISVRQISKWTCEVTFATDKLTVTEDISTRKKDEKAYEVKEDILIEFWKAMVDMAEFNGMSEAELMHMLYEKRLSKREKSQFDNLVNPEPDES